MPLFFFIMKIYIEKTNKRLFKKFRGKVGLLLKKLKISPETVIVARKGELITEEVVLLDEDEIKIISVISGG
jgi:sulfur carrier protein ThiS